MTTDQGLEWRFRALTSPWPLMAEVAAAAGGVAWSHLRLREAAAAVRLEVESDDWERKPVGDLEVLSIQMVDALWIALADMLTWVRTVDDRTSRTYSGGMLGLLASMPAGDARNRVKMAQQAYRAAGAAEARLWAAESLHVMAVPAAITPALVVWREHGPVVRFPFPDPAATRADARREPGGLYQLGKGRDAGELADALMAATEVFMRRVLGAIPRPET